MHLLRFDCVSAILYLLLFEGGKNTDDGFTMDNLYLLTVIQDQSNQNFIVFLNFFSKMHRRRVFGE